MHMQLLVLLRYCVTLIQCLYTAIYTCISLHMEGLCVWPTRCAYDHRNKCLLFPKTSKAVRSAAARVCVRQSRLVAVRAVSAPG
jgi:hypothetical protein